MQYFQTTIKRIHMLVLAFGMGSALAQIPLPGAMPAGQPMQPGQGAPGQPLGFNGQAPMPAMGELKDPTSPASQKNKQLPTVGIREFRSSVAEVTARGATDMFITALINSRNFRVVERARLSEGVASEKMLNQQGMSTGTAGQSKYTSAMYFFEATVSEATTGERQTGWGLGLMGAGVSKTSSSDTLGIDVRLVDVESGVVVDAQMVRKKITSEETKAGGLVNALAGSFLSGTAAAAVQNMQPVDQVTSARKDSVDKALREAIEEAIAEIAKRLPTS